jgi:hypothetical protein
LELKKYKKGDFYKGYKMKNTTLHDKRPSYIQKPKFNNKTVAKQSGKRHIFKSYIPQLIDCFKFYGTNPELGIIKEISLNRYKYYMEAIK